ncbi:MAG: hypothetical protein M4579_001931 [Chaenotheca gracillima]|nr:MAG: hypothetical protein M4579_001931 [Chaenotheca gracillima]
MCEGDSPFNKKPWVTVESEDEAEPSSQRNKLGHDVLGVEWPPLVHASTALCRFPSGISERSTKDETLEETSSEETTIYGSGARILTPPSSGEDNEHRNDALVLPSLDSGSPYQAHSNQLTHNDGTDLTMMRKGTEQLDLHALGTLAEAASWRSHLETFSIDGNPKFQRELQLHPWSLGDSTLVLKNRTLRVEYNEQPSEEKWWLPLLEERERKKQKALNERHSKEILRLIERLPLLILFGDGSNGSQSNPPPPSNVRVIREVEELDPKATSTQKRDCSRSTPRSKRKHKKGKKGKAKQREGSTGADPEDSHQTDSAESVPSLSSSQTFSWPDQLQEAIKGDLGRGTLSSSSSTPQVNPQPSSMTMANLRTEPYELEKNHPLSPSSTQATTNSTSSTQFASLKDKKPASAEPHIALPSPLARLKTALSWNTIVGMTKGVSKKSARPHSPSSSMSTQVANPASSLQALARPKMNSTIFEESHISLPSSSPQESTAQLSPKSRSKATEASHLPEKTVPSSWASDTTSPWITIKGRTVPAEKRHINTSSEKSINDISGLSHRDQCSSPSKQTTNAAEQGSTQRKDMKSRRKQHSHGPSSLDTSSTEKKKNTQSQPPKSPGKLSHRNKGKNKSIDRGADTRNPASSDKTATRETVHAPWTTASGQKSTFKPPTWQPAVNGKPDPQQSDISSSYADIVRGRRRSEAQRSRSDSIKFIRERTASRSSAGNGSHQALVRPGSGLSTDFPSLNESRSEQPKSDSPEYPATDSSDGFESVTGFPDYDEGLIGIAEEPSSSDLQNGTKPKRVSKRSLAGPLRSTLVRSLTLSQRESLSDEISPSPSTPPKREKGTSERPPLSAPPTTPPAPRSRRSEASSADLQISTPENSSERDVKAGSNISPLDVEKPHSSLNPLAETFSPISNASDLSARSKTSKEIRRKRDITTNPRTTVNPRTIERIQELALRIISQQELQGKGAEHMDESLIRQQIDNKLGSEHSTASQGGKSWDRMGAQASTIDLPRKLTPQECTRLVLASSSFAHLKVFCLYCDKICRDCDESTVLCLGCGPFSRTRYCCEDHRFVDLVNHWRVCSRRFLTEYIRVETLDHHFKDLSPAIPNVHGFQSFEFLRQRYFSMHHHDTCDYAIFDDWRKSKKAGYEVRGSLVPPERVTLHGRFWKDILNRTLNVCFLDHTLIRPLDLLYRIVRWGLAVNGYWSSDMENELCHQFKREFNLDPRPLCGSLDSGLKPRWSGRGGLEPIISSYERSHPILRMWRREHPDAKGTGDAKYPWRRWAGAGFPRAKMTGIGGHCGVGWEGIPPELDSRITSLT